MTTNSPSFWQKGWVKNGLTLLAFIAIYLAVRPFFQGEIAQGTAPTIDARSITGEAIKLSALQGQPVMVHFWATWCPICSVEQDGVEAVAKDWKVIKIAIQSGDDQTLLDYAHANDMDPSNIINDEDGQIFQTYGAKAVPATFFIHPDGHIETAEVGFTSSWGMRLRLWLLE